MNASELTELANTVPLADNHCHGVVGTPVTAATFADLATESDRPQPAGFTVFDSPLGVAIRAECAPMLGLPRHASAGEYLAGRAAVGDEEVSRRLLTATGISHYLIDTGYRSDDILSPEATAALGGGTSREIVRIEVLAEQLAAEGAGAAEFGTRFAPAQPFLRPALRSKT